MKVFPAVLVLFFSVLPLCGAEPVIRIADCIGDDAVRTAAVRLALNGRKTGFSQIRTLPETALAGLTEGRYDLVLIRVPDLPEKHPGKRMDYAIEAAMAVVHEQNPRSSFSPRELAEIWSGWRKSWKTLTGEEFQIHLLRQPETRFAVRLFRTKIMGNRSFAPAFEREDAAELLRTLRLNVHGMVLCERPDADFATDIKPVAVSGIAPSLENMRTGRYPLCIRRAVICREPASAEIRAFLQDMRSPEMAKILAAHGLIQP